MGTVSEIKPKRGGGRAPRRARVRCSFCRRPIHTLRFVVRSACAPHACICDHCVLQSAEIIRKAIYAGEA